MLTETTADLAFSLLMGAARQLAYLDRWTKQGEWKRTVGPAQFGQDIHGKTLGIIGLGILVRPLPVVGAMAFT